MCVLQSLSKASSRVLVTASVVQNMQHTHACFDVLSSANTGDEGAGEVLLYVVRTYVGLIGVLATTGVSPSDSNFASPSDSNMACSSV